MSMSEFENLPEHLKDDALFIQCDSCCRKSWGGESVNSECSMIQPSGEKCKGVLKAPQPNGE